MPTMRRVYPPRLWVIVLGVCAALMVAGCEPDTAPTLPPATRQSKPSSGTPLGPQPAPATPPGLRPPTVPAVPTAAKPPTAPPIGVPTAGAPGSGSRRTISVTILHTNDVRGETDPCG